MLMLILYVFKDSKKQASKKRLSYLKALAK